ncbi:hypothetical protein ETB97_012620 [Aspergillus alliaceus]|uniref:Amidase domain-containing protein n=1 Tax=Petromyces alliaceus TaxID=209559 RepID=A0A8H6A2X0_PETAA|nr:hypothetical protein ETB97_012620 [Aspergillus burnettii]
MYYIGREGGVLGALSRHELDALILPTPLAAYVPSIVAYNEFGNLVQTAENVPFGISSMGAHWSEETLIGMAYAFEQQTLARQKLRRYIEQRVEVSRRYEDEETD